MKYIIILILFVIWFPFAYWLDGFIDKFLTKHSKWWRDEKIIKEDSD